METFYLILVIILFLLAFSDLIVGVSNDAVNFLNSAVGSKAASFKTIMIMAALGVLVGATFSSGMMEVARKGIFNPQFFTFAEIMVIFLAVMITDIILLDTFNTFGMPTSTTVSIVFELLGAAVGMALIKVMVDSNSMSLIEYINSEKALTIISGILLSVVVAFTAGFIFQWLSRLIFTFNYRDQIKKWGALWGAIAFTSITYFILIKGSKGASFMTADVKASISENTRLILLLSFVFWTIVLQVINWFTKLDTVKYIVLIGTFALAMAFAGNDLVNFIGVPLAGYNSYNLWVETNMADPSGLFMEGLAAKVPTPTLLLLLSGLIMVITLLISKKARSVIKTSLDLGRQDAGYERFTSNAFSRSVVRQSSNFANFLSNNLPASVVRTVTRRFDDSSFQAAQKTYEVDPPSFDMIRAASTLVVSSILISLATNLKLPLSTTYVTFMVFMGTSLADGAWGRESAAYRISGVISVIGGWFFTAFSAFTAAFIVVIVLYYGGAVAVIAMVIFAALLIYRSYKLHDKRISKMKEFEDLIQEEILSKEKLAELGSQQLEKSLAEIDLVLKKTTDALFNEKLNKLQKSNKETKAIYKKIANRRSVLSARMESLAQVDIESAHFIFLVMDYLHEVSLHAREITADCTSHVDNHHKPLIADQINEIESIRAHLSTLLTDVIDLFKGSSDVQVESIRSKYDLLIEEFRSVRKAQIKRIKSKQVGTRNSSFYFNILGEFRNISLYVNRLMNVHSELLVNSINDPEEVVY